MSAYTMDFLLQLAILLVGYAIGAGCIALMLKAVGLFTLHHASMLVLVLPLVTVLTLEGFTRFWMTTPGYFAGFTAFMPMLAAGAFSAVAAAVAQLIFAPFHPHYARLEGDVSGWVGAAIVSAIVCALLWRYWPASPGRLF